MIRNQVAANIQPGETAMEFDIHGLFGNSVRLQDFGDKKLMLTFYRYASCPLRNLTVHEIIRRYDLTAISCKLIFDFMGPSPDIRSKVTYTKTRLWWMKGVWLLVLLTATALYFANASWLAPLPENTRIRFIAHRSVHQIFDRTGLNNNSCTAKQIARPVHTLLENTLASMRAAFAAGAEVVELDVHPTKDNRFAVFHDRTLQCRTNGTGRARDHLLAELKALDIGYGYTADGGATFPLRGKGVGLMPSLDEVFDAFPDRRFLINFKSHDAREGDLTS